MASPQEIEAKFWKALALDMTVMLGLDGVEDGHARPMTAQLDGERSPIWFFTAKDNAIVHNSWQRKPRHRNVCIEGARYFCDHPRQPQSGQQPRDH